MRRTSELVAALVVLVALSSVAPPAAASPSIICHDSTVSTDGTDLALQSCFTTPTETGEPFSMRVTVTNTGATASSHTVNLSVENATVDNETVSLAPNESVEVTLTTNLSAPGEYNVSVGNAGPWTHRVYDDIGLDPTPKDPDGDGAFEDVNGDGQPTVTDVQGLFANLDSEQVQSSPDRFDFNGDGRVSVSDVQALFVEVIS